VRLIILREHRPEPPVGGAKDHGVRDGLDKETGAGRESENHAGGQQNEENHGDEDVCVESGHL
jgi:hypothetical protein